MSVQTNAQAAASNVTIRDPFPRALVGLVGQGIAGGDDTPTHANHWSLTPRIGQITVDSVTMTISGIASPFALVDLYFDTQTTITRQIPVRANADGSFTFSGSTPSTNAKVFVVSTLDDSAQPQRVGSSSQFSTIHDLVTGTTPIPSATPMPSATPIPSATLIPSATVTPERLLSALGSVSNRTMPGQFALPGDLLRFTITITNVGTVAVHGIGGHNIQLPSATTLITGSGSISGGTQFIADDTGFSGGVLAPGEHATYTLNTKVRSDARPANLVYQAEVFAEGIISIPVVGRSRVVTAAQAPRVAVYLPVVCGGR